jgi:response regulator RpfG family c-di-GMP phosphodiesterase
MVIAIDDDVETLLMLKKVFISKGNQYVETFESAEEALRFIETNKDYVHVCVVDFRMPEMNGDEVARRIKSLDRDIRVVLISGFVDLTNAQRLFAESSIDEFFRKPIDTEKLWEVVERHEKRYVARKLRPL